MRFLLLLLCPLLVHADDGEVLFFSKSFPNSKPPYFEMKIAPGGKIEYREEPDEDSPIVFQLRAGEYQAMSMLAAKLDHFRKPLESGLPVARLGEKTFRWTKGAESHEQKFNYSLDPDAQALLDWVEKIAESALHFIDLERTAKYDRLGVNKTLLQIEAAWDRNRIVGHMQFLPLLKRVANNESYLNMARERAARLVQVFSDPDARPAAAVEAEKKGK